MRCAMKRARLCRSSARRAPDAYSEPPRLGQLPNAGPPFTRCRGDFTKGRKERCAMQKTPDWIVRCVDTFKARSGAQYPDELWRYAERSLSDLVSDRAGRAWVKLDARLANYNRLGRENFVMQVCYLAASSVTVPHTAPATAKRMATAAKRAITQ